MLIIESKELHLHRGKYARLLQELPEGMIFVANGTYADKSLVLVDPEILKILAVKAHDEAVFVSISQAQESTNSKVTKKYKDIAKNKVVKSITRRKFKKDIDDD